MKWRWGSARALRRRRDDAALNLHLERNNLSFALLAALEARDRRAAVHSVAVAIYARDIAARLGLSEAEQLHAHVCGLVHDIGMIGLPPGLLQKPGSLTLAERRVIETHSEIGERILTAMPNYAEIARVTRHHHERWDGTSYPDGLSDALGEPQARNPGRHWTTVLLVEQNALMALDASRRGHVLETARVVLTDDAKNLRENEQVRRTYLSVS
jgi:HD domain